MLDVAESGLHAQGPGRTPTGAAAGTGHTVAVLTLGRFEILLGQERRTEDDWPRRKVLRLFKCLTTQRDRRLAREQAMALFWPDAPPEAASDSLRSSLTILRQTLRPVPDLIQADRYHIWINPAIDYWCDAEEFERLGRRALTREGEPALYEQALRLYDGVYLPTDLYDDWATARRDSLHELWFSLVGGLSALYEQQGASDAAIAWLKQAAERDSCREDLQAQLMRLLAQTGRRVEALRQYQQLRESLRRELEVDPDPETTRLYERILRGEFGGSIATVLARPPSEGTRAHPLTAGTTGEPG